MDISSIVEAQRAHFMAQKTKPPQARLEALKGLRAAIQEMEGEIAQALKADLNKTDFEAYMTEIGMVLDDLGFAIKRLGGWAKPVRVKTPMAQFHAKSYVMPEPYGVALIMAPWNYPFQLSIEPLTGAIAAGNCAVIKPSGYAPATSAVIAKLIKRCFPPEHVAVVEGGRAQNTELLQQRFDYIFFTGSVEVGKLVMEAASRNLTPVSLELGGKSPCIVTKSADLKLSAKRLAFGKYLNSGQTCVAPDYLLIHSSVKEEFMAHFKRAVAEFYPGGDYSSMPLIVNHKHFDRLMALMEGEKVLMGGEGLRADRFIQPTVLEGITWQSPIMGEEVFGPILPVLTYDDLDQAIAMINARPKPLALYLFTADKAEERVLERVSFGGGCINDTIIHLATPHMGFGGVGQSGMGSYHGKLSFDTFTHYKSIVKKSLWLDLPMRYPPYSQTNFKMLKMFLK